MDPIQVAAWLENKILRVPLELYFDNVNSLKLYIMLVIVFLVTFASVSLMDVPAWYNDTELTKKSYSVKFIQNKKELPSIVNT